MKAILATKYGPPAALHLTEVEKPALKDNQVLVRVRAASVNPLDLQMRGGVARLWGGLRKPKDPRLGVDAAGTVEAVGSEVTQFKPGDEVFGSCAGSFAEYAVTREIRLALKPANLSFEEAAAAPVAAITALQGLRDKGMVRPGKKVLINGASGGVGTYAVQIAKSLGAEVIAVCSPRHLDLARSLGADQVIDYTQDNFTQSGKQYDLIFAINGYHPLMAYRRALTPQGIYMAVGGTFAQILQALILGRWFTKAGGQTLGFMGIAEINSKDLTFVKELLETGKVKSIIDRRYPLNETGLALQYLAEKHANGKVVITI